MGTGSQQLLERLMRQLGGMESQQSIYDDPRFQQRREAAMANLEAERRAAESSLQSEMARRGIFSSSIAGGRMGDIAGQFARAQASLEGDLLREAMQQDQQRQQFMLQQLGNIFGTVGEQELGGFRANIESAKAQADINARAAELQQEAKLRGRELDLQSARDQASKEYQSGQLALGYAEMDSRQRIAANELASRENMQREEQKFRAGESKLERDLREAMQTRELTAAEERQLRELAQDRQFKLTEATGVLHGVDGKPILDKDGQPIKTNSVQQAEKERELREKLANKEITAAEERQLRDIEAAKARQKEQITSQENMQISQQKFTQGQNELDRLLRERLGMTESTGIMYGPDGKPMLDAEGKPMQTLAGRQFDLSTTQGRNALLVQLASALAPLDQKAREEFLRNNPELAKLMGAPAPSRTASQPSSGVVRKSQKITGTGKK